jgi:uncharacterized protein (UPF0548 family)
MWPLGNARGEIRDLFRLTPPSEYEVQVFVSRQSRSSFSYAEVGASATTPPAHCSIDHNRIQLGRGETAWNQAVGAVRGWQMFNIPWLKLYWPTSPIRVGTDVAVLVHHFGFHSLNACRIVYVIQENEPLKRYGFAYGTLAEHAERGEERFTVEWNRRDNTVWYDILAFSRPNKLLVRLGYPLSRSLQKRFAVASKSAMLAAVRK